MKKNSYHRNQYGMATWLKIVLCVFAVGLLTAIVGSICMISFFKDMTDPIKTQAVANKIVTMVEPLPPPFEYGPVNISMFGYSGALINNTASKAVFFVIKTPKKAGDNAKAIMDKVAKGEAGLPDGKGGMPGNAGGGSNNNMNVEDQGELDCGGTKLYYVFGKAVAKSPGGAVGGPSGTEGGPKSVEVETFLGGADPPKDQNSETFVMGQQQDPNKHLSMDEIKNFLSVIKEI
jgi:hypothetical protein